MVTPVETLPTMAADPIALINLAAQDRVIAAVRLGLAGR
jgi:hypothetical protein